MTILEKLSNDIGNYKVNIEDAYGGGWSVRDCIASVFAKHYGAGAENSIKFSNDLLTALVASILDQGYLREATEDEMTLQEVTKKPEETPQKPDWKKARGL